MAIKFKYYGLEFIDMPRMVVRLNKKNTSYGTYVLSPVHTTYTTKVEVKQCIT